MGDPSAEAHGDHHGAAAIHFSRKDYVTGFLLAGLLTAIPFGLVMAHAVNPAVAAAIVMVLAGVQVVVHMVYFLHMNGKSEHGWTLLALVFTLLLLGIVLSGSMWVTHHLNQNMMPMSAQDMRQMP
jgi:cytochrome o ubiquinol oxidase operon protein cyoD